ncbi:Exonuclease VIII [Burkholderia multivorans]
MLIDHLDIDKYHALPDLSKSGLDHVNMSPAHFYALHRDPNRPAPKDRAGQLEGNLAHCAILEPDEFGNRYALGPDVSRATKAWKDFEAFLEVGQIGIKPDQYEAAMRQAESVRALPEIREALARGRAEVSAFWTDPETGVACRCRPDWVHDATDTGVILVDVKTYSSASPDEFRRQAARKRYHVQDAFYTDGFAAASGKDVLAFLFVAVETEWPFAAHAMMLDSMSREQGRADYARNLATYARCEASGEWPGYSKEITLITLPQWAFNTEEA